MLLDNKNKEIQLCNKDIFNLQLEVERLKSQNKDLASFKEKYNELLTKEKTNYNEIESPWMSLKELETSLKLSDKYTLKIIIEYLKLDSFELVKNIAKVINSQNSSEIIAFRDWALQRNWTLKELFEKIVKESEKPIHNKLKWEKI